MAVWRYKAIPMTIGAGLSHPGAAGLSAARRSREGEIAAASAAEARASLRLIGLQAIDVRPLRRSPRLITGRGIIDPLNQALQRWRRKRRSAARADLYDTLATMLEAGAPLLEALDAAAHSRQTGRGGAPRGSAGRDMVVQLRESLRSGATLGEAMALHSSWYDSGDIAMVDAATQGGTLPQVLRSLAQREEDSDELTQKLIGALAYPALIMAAAVGVTTFLSVKTLPTLVQILIDANVEPPPLTLRVMSVGQVIVNWWPALIFTLLSGVIAWLLLCALFRARGLTPPHVFEKMTPAVLRQKAVAVIALRLAEMTRAGVPLVEALRALAPTAELRSLRVALCAIADNVERGADLADALAEHHRLFNAEFTRLVSIGQDAGELDAALERLGLRFGRRSKRAVGRLAAALEPAAIVLLAILVGIVVMAGALPLIRLQEIL